MKELIFSVYDEKAEIWSKPIYGRTTALAVRQFDDAVNDPTTELHKYAGDYTLFEIGEWDDTEGTVEMLEAKKNLGNAIQFIKMPEPMSAEEAQKATLILAGKG